MKKPKFSVCIPTYNRAGLLKKAIESVLEQDFDDYEIIISDGGSVDNTEEIVKSFHSPKIRYVKSKKHLSMARNWNRPLELAKGEYAAFLHDDDEYRTNHLKEAYRVLSQYNDIGIYAVGNQGSRIDRGEMKGLIEPKPYFQYIYAMKGAPCPTQAIFKREHKNKKYFFNENYVYCPEVELYLEIAKDGLKAYYSNLQTTIRNAGDTTGTYRLLYNWASWVDEFKVLEKYKNHKYIDQKKYLEVLNIHINKAFFAYLRGKLENKGGPDEIFQNIKEISKNKFYFKHYQLSFLKKIGDILTRYHLIKMNNLKTVRNIYYFFRRNKPI